MRSAAPTIVFVTVVLAGCASSSEQREAGDAGCTISYRGVLQQNGENLNRLKTGMTRAEVVSTMGDCVVRGRGGPYDNPFRSDVLQKGADSYEVMYYLTRRRAPFTTVSISQATPVLLKNGILIGWGRTALEDTKRVLSNTR